MSEALDHLAAWEKRPALELLRDLLLPPADVLRFGESGPMADGGSLPLEHGLDLLSGVRKVLLAAACSVQRPQTFHPRLALAEAEQFLRRCQLGPTEVGSFVVPVACPLDIMPASEELFAPTPFTRRVTSLLMRSLHRLARALEIGAVESVLEPVPGEPVLSANLCEGLLHMTPEGDVSALTVTASWSRSLPPNEELPSQVRLRREVFGRIEALAVRLRPAREPHRQTFFGFVDTLNGRANADDRLEGPVILRLLGSESEPVRARADLGAEDYHTAWQAHGQHRAITVQGILRRAGRTNRLDEVTGLRLLPQSRPYQQALPDPEW
jgi:hypothetical protein